ncbi:MAG TPA: GNAT family N-acetyltransferase [Candidatus Limnocylindrales bacterium]|nr:GNAT family N-acetyltransferase [Candidatus Limnocylindrales bacterium]
MQVRRITPDDRKELVKLIIDFENSSQNLLSPLQAGMRAYKDLQGMAEEKAKKYLSKPSYLVFVVDENGSLKGYISGEIIEKKYRIYNKEGYVENWFVEKDYQNHGIGKELFETLIKEFEKSDCTHINLDTNINNKRAIDIYEHMGFTKRLVTFFKPLKKQS